MVTKIKRIKSNKFFFGSGNYKYGHLYLRKSFSNIFLTFTDSNNKVIICKTSGNLVLKDLNGVNVYLLL